METANITPTDKGGLQVFDGGNRHYDGYNAKDANNLSTFHLSERMNEESREVRSESRHARDDSARRESVILREFSDLKHFIIEKANHTESLIRETEKARLISELADAKMTIQLAAASGTVPVLASRKA